MVKLAPFTIFVDGGILSFFLSLYLCKSDPRDVSGGEYADAKTQTVSSEPLNEGTAH